MAKLNDTEEFTDEEIEEILYFDAIREAQKQLGKDSQEALALGLLYHQQAQEAKKEVLKAGADTFWACPMSLALQCAQDMGFELINSCPLPEWEQSKPRYQRMFYGFYSPKRNAILTMNDSAPNAYMGDTEPVSNSVSLTYQARELFPGNYIARPRGSAFRAGEMENNRHSWYGELDLREGFKFKLRKLDSLVEYLNPWTVSLEESWGLHLPSNKKSLGDWREDKLDRAIKYLRLMEYPELLTALNCDPDKFKKEIENV